MEKWLRVCEGKKRESKAYILRGFLDFCCDLLQ